MYPRLYFHLTADLKPVMILTKKNFLRCLIAVGKFSFENLFLYYSNSSLFLICSWLLSTSINVTLSTWAMERPANGPTLGKNSFPFLETCTLEIKLHLFFFVFLLHVFLWVSFFGMHVTWTCHCFSKVFSMPIKIICNAWISIVHLMWLYMYSWILLHFSLFSSF